MITSKLSAILEELFVRHGSFLWGSCLSHSAPLWSRPTSNLFMFESLLFQMNQNCETEPSKTFGAKGGCTEDVFIFKINLQRSPDIVLKSLTKKLFGVLKLIIISTNMGAYTHLSFVNCSLLIWFLKWRSTEGLGLEPCFSWQIKHFILFYVWWCLGSFLNSRFVYWKSRPCK